MTSLNTAVNTRLIPLYLRIGTFRWSDARAAHYRGASDSVNTLRALDQNAMESFELRRVGRALYGCPRFGQHPVAAAFVFSRRYFSGAISGARIARDRKAFAMGTRTIWTY
jgi:hypothetical protein